MSNIIASTDRTLIVGLGATGLSVARYLEKMGKQFLVADEREQPPAVSSFESRFPGVPLLLGPLDFDAWPAVSRIVLSPGVPRAHPAIQRAIAQSVPVVGDIELFAQAARAPIVAITGSNGKTTVTTLVGEMARTAGVKVGVGGNIGVPALDLLDEGHDLYVLELSSFQLESTSHLKAKVSSILNISADHMDRYPSLQAYVLAKQRIAFGAERLVINRADPLTQPPVAGTVPPIKFGLGAPDLKDFGLLDEDGVSYLAQGLRPLMPVSELKIKGTHNILNALSALAIASAAGIAEEAALTTLRTFPGLPHRCQFVANINGVDFYNDSKATNVGAATAALKGLAPTADNIILIAGGQGKGADFTELGREISRSVKTLVLLGVDAEAIASACAENVAIKRCETLEQAVLTAYRSAKAGDLVLLSPACASFDMFKNYEDRGEQFVLAVEALKPC